ncbi:aldo/keto reductase [Mycolicibacterium smegmatis]|uniref:Oxidoreductase, aldo/keto reductase family n=2 Tax=Mycolicibacterium smegmatis (strain ATCC 700084 / mc(2)155) TaxID=246196 RepID=I7G4D1_MYCS2|nr:aldo/keto reductase [Mycolicibacterium smegmatis]ABK73850.1 oxidoreductase, aldo/keto reductase family protein [Mycolicibacterium smegmatis MC2 155]AFP40452.1 Oxidoreductase, aldo/keto reductase family [Mycolicibacterium smegmatis MC2 155]AIU09194.1 aldo/keto reductase [Mycolicibacterium smegmatis MC2 155]AIU15819.1 aldo/keto reductase [Mycolicibacterium smegmatis]AIU22442.1 aldo/keto reductase [Mycolicibacterium smegmatis]
MSYGTFETTHTAADDRYDKIPYRRSGRSGLDLPAFSFGLWQKFGTDYPFETQREIILHAFDLGITHFDNADRYGPPHRAAQQNFGRVLTKDLARYRDELILSTKAGNPIGPSPYLRGGSRKSLLTSLEHSLGDLGTDHVDIFYSHSTDLSTPLEETVGALVSAVEQGKALYVGISNYLPDRAHDTAALLAEAGVPLLVHQPRYSIFDRRIEQNGLLELAGQDGFGLVVYSPLAQGLLTNKYLESIPEGARAANSTFLKPDAITDTYRQRTAELNKVAESRGQSLAQLALQWVLRHPNVTSALIGASSTGQLDHNVNALQFPPFTDEELALIDEHGVHGTGLNL